MLAMCIAILVRYIFTGVQGGVANQLNKNMSSMCTFILFRLRSRPVITYTKMIYLQTTAAELTHLYCMFSLLWL